MLDRNKIPKTEPHIRVGIILPEDNRKQIEVFIPKTMPCTLKSDNTPEQILKNVWLHFSIVNEMIQLGSTNRAKSWIIEPCNDKKIKPKSGAVIKNVLSGRGFHWQKEIDVFLPGKIEIRIIGKSLILINELSLEQYIPCVTTSEMSRDCPGSFIKAQTIAARSWLLANSEQKHKSLTIDVCNDDCCQRYQGTGQLSDNSIIAAHSTYGHVLLYENKICDARYSKNCGGITENYSVIWNERDIKYLTSVYDAPSDHTVSNLIMKSEQEIINWIDCIPTCFCSSKIVPQKSLKKYLGIVDTKGSYFRWQKKYSQAGITGLIKNKLAVEIKAIQSFEPLTRGTSGRISKLKIHYLDQNDTYSEMILESEYKIRETLDKKFLYSSCFYIEHIPESTKIPDEFIIRGAGWGHGVGMCQIGALGMALQGYSTEEILKHYYRGSELVKIY